MACNRHIRLVAMSPEPVKFFDRKGFRVVIRVEEAVNMPKEIFGFHRVSVDALTGKSQDEFSFVCSPYDLATYPANLPDDSKDPYFRKDSLDVVLPSVSAAQKFIDAVYEEVGMLVRLLCELDKLQVVRDAWIPGPPEGSSSSSSSQGP